MHRESLAATDWRAMSACRREDPELFFPIGDTGPCAVQIEQAKAVCRDCAVVTPCLRWALETREAHGIWGATTETERRRLRRQPPAVRADVRGA
ncbi:MULTISPECIES: WhiB family transcriptional regulator [Streptomyces]|uniref:Transcriptional regulator WhiB n=1 Tax=Streptomyces canarius TaxID=285453 RepID=A0ABQ3CU25_9ACTN|nr:MULTISPECIES: WhiB family transcriptional regulator [Streptomyces]GGZ01200.1 transcriptional regulator WhiB [Streptomyces olivaceoviridis]GHA34155.1 transcriptional regulator WhiB [Streptomyces canarius]